MEGQGNYTWPNGKKYEGEWKDGKKDGKGIILYEDGSKMEGVFRDDSPGKLCFQTKNIFKIPK